MSSTSPLLSNESTIFFQSERDRFISDISKGLEVILTNNNLLNRKLEESISVGKEFEPIAELWSRFEKSIPLPPQQQQQEKREDQQQQDRKKQDHQNVDEKHQHQEVVAVDGVDGDVDVDDADQLPPGVAPGGGLVYS